MMVGAVPKIIIRRDARSLYRERLRTCCQNRATGGRKASLNALEVFIQPPLTHAIPLVASRLLRKQTHDRFPRDS